LLPARASNGPSSSRDRSAASSASSRRRARSGSGSAVVGIVPFIVGLIAAAANYGVARVLREPAAEDAAIRLAYVHNLGDTLVSLAPVLAGILTLTLGSRESSAWHSAPQGRHHEYADFSLTTPESPAYARQTKEIEMGRVTYLLLALSLPAFLCGVGARCLDGIAQAAAPSEDAADENTPAEDQDGVGPTEPLMALCAPARVLLSAPRSFSALIVPAPVRRAGSVTAAMRSPCIVTPLRC